MKLLLIFLISILYTGCTTIMKQYAAPPVSEFYALDTYEEVFRPRKLKGVDKPTCKFKLEPLPKVPLTHKKMTGSVCISAEDYQKWRERERKKCQESMK